MKDRKFIYALWVLLFCYTQLSAGDDCSTPEEALRTVRNMMKNMVLDNNHFRCDPLHDKEYFKRLASQKPRTTIVGCADSRVHTSNFDKNPIGDIFFIRNIGNQIEPCLGSVEYGIRHLETPLLLFLGHSGCGAIKAATCCLDELEESIRSELSPMSLTHKDPDPSPLQLKENMIENVHNQVNKACVLYADLIAKGLLYVVGATYDFTTDRQDGMGKFTVVQVNDSTDKQFIESFVEAALDYGDYHDDPGRP